MIDKIDAAIGRAIRKARRAKDMTQTELGDELGVTYQQVQKYEKGASPMVLGRFLRACEVLGIPAGKHVRAWIDASQK